MLIGAEDALYGIATRNGGKKKPVQIPGIGRVYQMSLVEELGLIIAIVGRCGLICLFWSAKYCIAVKKALQVSEVSELSWLP